MRGNIFSQPFIISNLISLLILIIVLAKPIFGRMLISLIFIAAAIINTVVAITNPDVYKVYESLAALPVYEDFIRGPFSLHITTYVIIIAAGQLMIGLGLAMKGMYESIALVGAIIFLLAIAPLGAGSSFPCTVILALACGILLREEKRKSWFTLFLRLNY
ncbi:hypothetical protein GO495_20655 [Chitinophaga oryziterrae]|uniref:Uncharacterized protein n=1 Tax=Chitinophaga oryziterrae TaxID=1031224 RepID=A0A6N8JCT3_9BACT|nr:hypothetical protein [Chitinophaga oryziterrae]MVT43020.1 hypothetical protein [Chitinophaga oryziterrae]